MPDVTQDLLFTELELKQDSILPLKHGLYSSGEGANGNLCICVHNGTHYLGIKVQSQWHYVSIINAVKLAKSDTQKNQTEFKINNIVKDNFADYLYQFQDLILNLLRDASQLGSWAVGCNFEIDYHHSDDSIVNYLTFNTNSTSSGGSATVSDKSFLVPFGCKLKNINFAITVADASESAYAFELLVKSYTSSVSSLTTESTISFSATNPTGEAIRYINVVINVSMNITSHYFVTIRQTGFPSDKAATKPSKAIAYFEAI